MAAGLREDPAEKEGQQSKVMERVAAVVRMQEMNTPFGRKMEKALAFDRNDPAFREEMEKIATAPA